MLFAAEAAPADSQRLLKLKVFAPSGPAKAVQIQA